MLSQSKLAASANFGISLAVAKAGATEKGKPLYAHFAEKISPKLTYVMPAPCFAVISSGKQVEMHSIMQM
jgi:enolase